MKSIAIIGASADRDKFGNKAVRAFKKKGYKVFPINLKEEKIEDLKCYKSVLEVPENIDIASLYLPQEIGLKVIEEVAKKQIKEIYLNPGTESDELIEKCKKLGINPLVECSIRAIGEYPNNY
jgi:uncharacterized protein